MHRYWMYVLAAGFLFFAPIKESYALVDAGGGWYCQRAYVDGQYQGLGNCQYFGSTGSDGGGGSYEYGGGGDGRRATCRNLLLNKPEDCVNEIPIPSSAEYGYGTAGGEYQGGSGLPRLIAWKNNGPAVSGISQKITNILQNHTQALATGFVSRSVADQDLTQGLQSICSEQAYASPWPYIAGTEKCLTTLNRLVQERNDSTWLSGLRDWVATNFNADISVNNVGFDFNTLISLLDPENSLAVKADLVKKDNECAMWWQEARDEGCLQ
ncbi:MAG: hypothetical protein WKF61_08220 [Luteimonas sp.]